MNTLLQKAILTNRTRMFNPIDYGCSERAVGTILIAVVMGTSTFRGAFSDDRPAGVEVPNLILNSRRYVAGAMFLNFVSSQRSHV